MSNGKHISQDDLALHAMQALSPEESAEVRSHLAECADCRAELANITGDLSLVALSVEQHAAPVGARERFIQRIEASPKAVQATNSTVIPFAIARTPRRLSVWLPWAAAAALLLVALGLEMKNRDLQLEIEHQSALVAAQTAANARAQEVLDVLTAPSAQRVLLTSAKTRPAPSARAVYLPSRGALILQASNLDPIPQGKTYELWVIPANGSAPIPAGRFWPDAAGSASLVLPKIPEGVLAKAFGVTIEKNEGSATPTAPIVLSGAVSGD